MTYLPGLALRAGRAVVCALRSDIEIFFVVLGVISILLTVWLAARLRIIDRDASPYHRLPQMLVYLGWLIVEIVKSNIAVIARVLGPRHEIDPAVVRLRASARTDLGRALFRQTPSR